MNTHQWSSSRYKQLIDLHKFSRKQLIKEIIAERKEYLELEKILEGQWEKLQEIKRTLKKST